MLNLTLSLSPGDDDGYVVYLRGTNLLDEAVWNHASYLANVVPLPGRGVCVAEGVLPAEAVPIVDMPGEGHDAVLLGELPQKRVGRRATRTPLRRKELD